MQYKKMDVTNINSEQKHRLSININAELMRLEAELAAAIAQLEILHDQMRITTEQLNEIKAMLEENKGKIRDISVVQQEIDKILPLIEKAKASIKDMGLDQLNEISSYKNPPERIRMVLEAITLVLTGKKLTWDGIKKEMANDFVDRVLKINWNTIKPAVFTQLKSEYFNNPEWVIGKIYRASQAIGPLADWMMGYKQLIEAQSLEEPHQEELNVLYDEKQKLEEEELNHTEVIEDCKIKEIDITEHIKNLERRKTILLDEKSIIDKALLIENQKQTIEAGVQTEDDNQFIEKLMQLNKDYLTNIENLNNEILKLHDEYALKLQDQESKYLTKLAEKEKQFTILEENFNNKVDYIKLLETKEKDYKKEIEALNERYSDKEDEFKRILNEFELKIQHDFKFNNSTIGDLHDKISQEEEKIRSLEEQLKKAIEENELLKKSAHANESSHKLYISEMNERIASIITEKENMIKNNEIMNKSKDDYIRNIETRLDNTNKDYENYKQITDLASNEKDSKINNLEDKVKLLMNKNHKLISENADKALGFEEVIQNLNDEIKNLSNKNKNLEQEYIQKLKEKTEYIHTLEGKLNLTTNQLDDLNKSAIELNHDNDKKMKELLSVIETLKNNNHSLNEKMNIFEKENKKLQSNINDINLSYETKIREYIEESQKYKVEIRSLNSQISETSTNYETNIKALKSEISELSINNTTINDQLERNNLLKKEETDNLKNELDIAKKEKLKLIANLKEKENYYEDKLSDLNKLVSDYESQLQDKNNYILILEQRSKDADNKFEALYSQYQQEMNTNSNYTSTLKEEYKALLEKYDNYTKWAKDAIKSKDTTILKLETQVSEFNAYLNRLLIHTETQTNISSSDIDELYNKIKALESHNKKLEQKIEAMSIERENLIKNFENQIRNKDIDITIVKEEFISLMQKYNKIIEDTNITTAKNDSYIKNLEEELIKLRLLTNKVCEDTAIQTSIRNMSAPKNMITSNQQTILSTISNNGNNSNLCKNHSYVLFDNNIDDGRDAKSTQCDFKLYFDAGIQTDRQLTIIDTEFTEGTKTNQLIKESQRLINNNQFMNAPVNVSFAGCNILPKNGNNDNNDDKSQNYKTEEESFNNKNYIFYNENKRLTEHVGLNKIMGLPNTLNVEIYYDGVKVKNEDYERVKSRGRYDSNFSALMENNRSIRSSNNRTPPNDLAKQTQRYHDKSKDISPRVPSPSETNGKYQTKKEFSLYESNINANTDNAFNDLDNTQKNYYRQTFINPSSQLSQSDIQDNKNTSNLSQGKYYQYRGNKRETTDNTILPIINTDNQIQNRKYYSTLIEDRNTMKNDITRPSYSPIRDQKSKEYYNLNIENKNKFLQK